MISRLLFLLTRTPLHVGTGASVGAIDQPVARERHTGFPIIPASSIKGPLADQWPTSLKGDKGQQVRLKTKKVGENFVIDGEVSEAAWLFGSDEAKEGFSAAGALLFGEARLLAFPIRSARGSFAWITSPLLLRRAAREGVFSATVAAAIQQLTEPGDGAARFAAGKLELDVTENGQVVKKVVLEEYTFARPGQNGDLPTDLGAAVAALIADDPVWKEVATRLVILSDGQLSHFVTTACEVAQHVRIKDETGTADPGGLFNQENVPSETLFYATVRATDSRLKGHAYESSALTSKTAAEALTAFASKVIATKIFQFGADASTGLGYCTVKLSEPQGA